MGPWDPIRGAQLSPRPNISQVNLLFKGRREGDGQNGGYSCIPEKVFMWDRHKQEETGPVLSFID